MVKAVIITGENVQDHEFIYPYYRLKEAGFEIFVALLDGKTKGYYGTNIPCDDECKIIEYWEMLNLDPDLIIIPGGAKAMEKLRQEKDVLKAIRQFDIDKKPIGVICHGAQLLISALKERMNKRYIAGYYSIKDDIENSGAIYSEFVVVDKNIISAAHYKDIGKWMKKILENLS